MSWVMPLGRIAGIAVHVHATFLLLLAWVAAIGYGPRASWRDAATGVAYIVVVFATVVLHELGHALMARRYGIRTHDITLLPIGGVARLERMPDDPRAELAIALAGPAVNILLAALCYAGLILTGTELGGTALSPTAGNWWGALLVLNVGLALFNLIPAFPMDGGRVLRALLALRLGRPRATRVAARVGRAFAIAFAIYAVMRGQPFLLLIALFIWVGATGEAATMEASREGDQVRR
jgi:Zn-dependent protease